MAVSIPVSLSVRGSGWLQNWGIDPAVWVAMALERHPAQGDEFEELAVAWSCRLFRTMLMTCYSLSSRSIMTRNKHFGKMPG